ncbi:hypothetical protein PTI98_007718 [Pleurotus ostreatus]|nr:hypothetical protein PTI98_007718 [Pleurotus ostreatus]
MQLKVNNTLFILSVVGVALAIPLQARAPAGIIGGAASGATELAGSIAGGVAQAGEGIGSGGLSDVGGVAGNVGNAADSGVIAVVNSTDAIFHSSS